MGKKKFRKTYVSKGTAFSSDPALSKLVRRERSEIVKQQNKLLAWEKGQNPFLSVPNPNCDGNVNTNKRIIRVRANDYWGDPRAHWSIKTNKKDPIVEETTDAS